MLVVAIYIKIHIFHSMVLPLTWIKILGCIGSSLPLVSNKFCFPIVNSLKAKQPNYSYIPYWHNKEKKVTQIHCTATKNDNNFIICYWKSNFYFNFSNINQFFCHFHASFSKPDQAWKSTVLLPLFFNARFNVLLRQSKSRVKQVYNNRVYAFIF